MSDDIVALEVVLEPQGPDGPFFVDLPRLVVRGESFPVPTIGKYVIEFEQDSVATITLTMPVIIRVKTSADA